MSSRSETIANAQDHPGERRLALAFGRSLGWSGQGLSKLPIFYELDFAVTRGKKITAWLEVKERGAYYPDWIFPYSKWLTGKRFSRDSGAPFYIVQAYPSKSGETKIIYLEVTEELRPEIIMAGRTDRGDWQDIAPHVSLPDEWFLRVQ